MARYVSIWTDLGLRLAGAALLGVAALAANILFGAGARGAMPIDYLVAAIGFLSASAGCALAWQGRHLFDQIALSSRWTFHQVARANSSSRRARDDQ